MLGPFPKVNWKEEGEDLSRFEGRKILCLLCSPSILVNCLSDFRFSLAPYCLCDSFASYCIGLLIIILSLANECGCTTSLA